MAYPLSPRETKVLLHPVWWLSLAVLVLNDHVLKGSGALPGWLTGKISDFAGLVVAPVLLFALVGRARLACFAAVAAVFSVLELSDAAARAVEAIWPWRIWTDPSDLVALMVLPLAWRISVSCGQGARIGTLRGRDRAGLVLGAVACLATSAPVTPGTWTTDAFVVNRGSEMDLRIRWVTGALDCDAVEDVLGPALGRQAFGAGVTFHLVSGDTIPLDRAAAVTAAGAASRSGRALPPGPVSCDVVLLSAEGMPDTLVFWRKGALRAILPTLPPAEDPGSGAFEIQEEGLALRGVAHEGVVATPWQEAPELPPCAAEAESFAWSESGLGEAAVRIDSIERGADGCFALGLSSGALPSSWFFLCVPEEAFPFEVGDDVEITHLTTASQRSLRLVRPEPARLEMVVYSGITGVDDLGVQVQMVPADCTPRRLDCGASVVSGLWSVSPGSMIGRSTAIGPATLWVGRVEQVIVSHPDCEGRETVGIRGDVVILSEEAP